MDFASWIELVVGLVSLAFTATGALAAFLFYRRAPLSDSEVSASSEGVSILKPLKGADRETYRNLESFFWLAHPKFELLFCVAHADDPAVGLVRSLREAYPEVSARLFIDGTEIGPNPKINNLRSGYRAARYESILISDSNIRVGSRYLLEMEHQFRNREMICSVVVGNGAGNFVGGVEEVFLGGFYARGMIISSYLGHPCMMGKSMMFQKAVMDRLGGLEALAPYLAEDFMAGEMVRKAGYRVGVSRFPVAQTVGRISVPSFWSRHLRWGRIRKTHAPAIFLVEPVFTNALVASGLASVFLAKAGYGGLMSFAGYLGAWFLLDCLAIGSSGTRLSWKTPLYWITRELIHIPLWLHIAAGNRIVWKSQSWLLGRGGRLSGGVASSGGGFHEEEGVAARSEVAEKPGSHPTLY